MGSHCDDGPKALRLGAGPRVGGLVSSELKKKASRAKESVHE